MQRKIALGLAFVFLASQAAGQELSDADRNAQPFPPGEHAALVKETCTECHSANLVTDKTFDRASAERYYKLMVSEDISTDDAQKIIEYLSTTLND